MGAHGEKPIKIPIGYDAYRQWYNWPLQRLGVRAYMRSTFDRNGRNEGADASHFLYQERDNFNVSLDTLGPGCLYFARYNHWHGSPWHYEIDKRDFVLQESSSDDPNHPVENSTFLPDSLFPSPLTYTWSVTRGADLNWVPMPFEKSFRMAYERTHYGTGYYIFHKFLPDTSLSTELKSWSKSDTPAQDVIALLASAGSDLTKLLPEEIRDQLAETSGTIDLPALTTVTLAGIPTGPHMVHALHFSVPREQAEAFGRASLRITWDEADSASVEAPLNLFFGAGTLYNRDDAEYLVKALPVNIRFDQNAQPRVHLDCYFPMPYFSSARIELAGTTETLQNIQWKVATAPLSFSKSDVGYFHATYKDFPVPQPGTSLELLDTRKAEGGGDWSGCFVGTSFVFSDKARLGTLEGDPRFYFDDSQTPQAQGTGSEEWGGGGDYWGGRTMTLPLAGHPVGVPDAKDARNDQDLIHSAYRFLLADLMPFGKRAVITLEHGAENDSSEHYKTVTYWYGINAPSLVETDQLDVGDVASEQAHQYTAPEASDIYEVSSRYEGGPEELRRHELIPVHVETGRRTTGTTEFNVKLLKNNRGVLLRRTLDYAYANQQAQVYVQGTDDEWQYAGTWYLSGGEQGVYSNPAQETGPAQHVVQASNRRFMDDEFLLPLGLTQNRETIRLRMVFDPVTRPLFPGYPMQETAWADFKYIVLCYQTPIVNGSPAPRGAMD